MCFWNNVYFVFLPLILKFWTRSQRVCNSGCQLDFFLFIFIYLENKPYTMSIIDAFNVSSSLKCMMPNEYQVHYLFTIYFCLVHFLYLSFPIFILLKHATTHQLIIVSFSTLIINLNACCQCYASDRCQVTVAMWTVPVTGFVVTL